MFAFGIQHLELLEQTELQGCRPVFPFLFQLADQGFMAVDKDCLGVNLVFYALFQPFVFGFLKLAFFDELCLGFRRDSGCP